MNKQILTINGGSSSIKFSLYTNEGLHCVLSGTIDRIGISNSRMTLEGEDRKKEESVVTVHDTTAVVDLLFTTLSTREETGNICAVAHRVVHGMEYKEHIRITPELRDELRRREDIDPEHLPLENAIIDAAIAQYPDIPQFACFDTVFHRMMPKVARTLPIPRRFQDMGIERYGFHGISCAYIIEELRHNEPDLANGRIIIAHLGSGASVTAISGGVSVDTTMGFTPTGGIPMSSRSGDIDPSTTLYIARKEGLSLDAMEGLVTRESGLRGVSGTTADMHDLLLREEGDPHAKEAIDLFCYETKKRIASFAGVLGGIDALIFTGGIGERSELIRKRICSGLEWMGIDVRDASKVRVMHADEQLMLARIVARLI